MTDSAIQSTDRPRRPMRRGFLIGLVLAPLAGAGAFFAVTSGWVPLPSRSSTPGKKAIPRDFDFVPIDPLLISLGRAGSGRFLRFEAQMEVPLEHVAEVQGLMPRIIDVLNGFLRALEMQDIEDPAALIRLRGQMLRRVQIVTGEGRVRDLLVIEFVVS